MLTASVVAATFSMVIAGISATPDPGGCAVVDSHGRCLVVALDPGRPGGPDALPPRPHRQRTSTPQPRSTPPLVAVPVGRGGFAQRPLPDIPGIFASRGVATTLAQRAVSLLDIAPPVMRLSATGSGYVGLPLWLWVDAGVAGIGPVSATATAGAATVTAVGQLTAVDWNMGPPGAVVRCTGPGTPWTGQTGPSPDCGYVYSVRSLPQRTGGTGRWTITATGVWTVTWTGVDAGVPVTGTDTLRLTSQAELPVGEVQVLNGGGS